jgi:photosynthetic reaction center cytochrome c subunit
MPAAQVYQNLKFFSGNAGQLQSSMNFMAASLGVGCGHCHVEGAWEKDDKPAKDSARKMLALVRDIRQEYGSVGRIGCFTCHHGGVKPETNPPPA